MPREIDPCKSTLMHVPETIFTDDLEPSVSNDTMVSTLNTSVQVVAWYRTGNKPWTNVDHVSFGENYTHQKV